MTQNALQRWEQLGWPTRHNEAWKNFPVRPLRAWDVEETIVSGPVPTAELEAIEGPRVVLRDGVYDPSLSHTGDTFVVTALKRGDVMGSHIPADRSIEALNEAHLTGGVHIRGAGTLTVVHLVTGKGVAHVRVILEAEPNEVLSVGQLYRGYAGPYFNNVVVEALVPNGATIELASVVRESAESEHLETVHGHVLDGGRFDAFTLVTEAGRARTAVDVLLAGAHAKTEVDGLYLGNDRQRLDHVTDITHVVGDTTSSETWAGVMDGRSVGAFQGLIRILKGASRSSTEQLTRSLILSDDAQAHAKPELFIDHDDVAAIHGATIGQLSDEERFYLMSRGIAPDRAQAILIRAFVDKQLDFVPERLHDFVEKNLTAAIGAGVSL